MLKIIQFIFILLLGSVTDIFAQQYVVKGQISGRDSGQIYMAHFNEDQKIIKVDTAQIKEGKFEFSGKVISPTSCMLGVRYLDKSGALSGIVYQGNFMLDSGETIILCHQDSLKSLSASGTKAQDEFLEFKNKINPHWVQRNNLYGKKLLAEKQKNKKRTEEIDKDLQKISLKEEQLIVDHVNLHPSSIVSAYIVNYFLLNPKEEVIQRIYDLLSSEVKASNYGNKIYNTLQAAIRLSVGAKAPLFTLSDVNGKPISLENFKGKYVLLDFWASWCGPCRAENPNLLSVYRSFKDKGFEIISISMDSNKQNWLNAIKQDHMTWVQLSDLKASKSEMKKMYEITILPTSFLLNKEGLIIAKNLKGSLLNEKLKEIFSTIK